MKVSERGGDLDSWIETGVYGNQPRLNCDRKFEIRKIDLFVEERTLWRIVVQYASK